MHATYNVVNRDMNQLDKIPNEAHYHKSHADHSANLNVLCACEVESICVS